MIWLHAEPGDQNRDGDLMTAVLGGIAAGQDEDAALARLLDDGEFNVAEMMLSQCRSLSVRAVRQAARDIDSGRYEAVSSLSDRVRRLQELADAADVPFDPSTEELERLAYQSRKAASRLLDVLEKDLATVIDQRVGDLRDRLRATRLPAETTRMIESLLASKRVRAAAHALKYGTLDMPGPEIQPPLKAWTWQESPLEVLRWYIDPNIHRPAQWFAEWEPRDEAARRLVAALDELNTGEEGAARAFAVALDGFLVHGQVGTAAEPPVVHPISGGFLTSVRNVFASEPLARFHPTGRVPLFVSEPGGEIPPEMSELGHFIAVGSRLEPAGRGTCAVLSVRDLLRLATVPFRRDISLARVVGRQWSPGGLGAGSATELTRLLGESDDRNWQTLCWLADLIGLGGSAAADSLLFQSGGDPGVLCALLEFLLDLESRERQSAQRRSVIGALHTWSDDKQAIERVEKVALRGCRSPAARAAFWSASAAAPPGTGLSLDTLVVASSLLQSDLDWDAPLRDGLDHLAHQWFAESAEQGTVSLRRIGVTIGLRRLAEQRLAEIAASLRAPAQQTSARSGLSEWTAYRFTLSPHWPAYRNLVRSGTATAQELEEARAALDVPVDSLIRESAVLAGEADLMPVVAEVRDTLRAQYPAVTVEVDGPPEALVVVPDRVALALLYELMRNAVEAIDGIGTIAVTVRPAGSDVMVDVRDTGEGLPAEIDSGFRVFRAGFSTRGLGHGHGLFLARQVAQQTGGDVELVSRAGGHPILHGAHFCLVLPRRA